MKTESMGEGTSHIKKDQKDLLNESKETNSIELKNDNAERSFGILDMWNLQKRMRSVASMRRRVY